MVAAAACCSCDVVHCPDRRVPGLSYPGGWATTITVPAAALARIPGELQAAEAAPFGCAGVTAFNALRYGGAEPGDRVAVVGIGGLGHLAVRCATAMDCETVAIGRGEQKRQTALDPGAHHNIDAAAQEPGVAVREFRWGTVDRFHRCRRRRARRPGPGGRPIGSRTAVASNPATADRLCGEPLWLPTNPPTIASSGMLSESFSRISGGPLDFERAPVQRVAERDCRVLGPSLKVRWRLAVPYGRRGMSRVSRTARSKSRTALERTVPSRVLEEPSILIHWPFRLTHVSHQIGGEMRTLGL